MRCLLFFVFVPELQKKLQNNQKHFLLATNKKDPQVSLWVYYYHIILLLTIIIEEAPK